MHVIAVAGNPAYSNTFPVTYNSNVSPNMILVAAYGGPLRATGYTLIDANTIRMEDSNRCVCKRGG